VSSDELDCRLAQIKDKKLASETRRFLLNLFLLFDGDPPPPIQRYIVEILELLEAKGVPARVRI